MMPRTIKLGRWIRGRKFSLDVFLVIFLFLSTKKQPVAPSKSLFLFHAALKISLNAKGVFEGPPPLCPRFIFHVFFSEADTE